MKPQDRLPVAFDIRITDSDWFRQLSTMAPAPAEVNFWQPGGKQSYHVVPEGGLVLFKLHSPDNFIVGGGFFLNHSFLPVSMAWQSFEQNNGCSSVRQFLERIKAYRRDKGEEAGPDPVVGCILLTSPFFFPRDQWIKIPESFKLSIQQGKKYMVGDPEAESILGMIKERLDLVQSMVPSGAPPPVELEEEERMRYGNPIWYRPRIGQGGFRVRVLERYHRQCAVTGEKTLTVLEAAHIRPYADEGPHAVKNGLLMRSDFHKLFDAGYVTVTPQHEFRVSTKLREDFSNGKVYYDFDGKGLLNVPDLAIDRPSEEYLAWHGKKVFRNSLAR